MLFRFDLVADGSLDQVCDNLVDLESYSEGIILHHIRTRFEKGNIYTFVGKECHGCCATPPRVDSIDVDS